MTTQITPAAYGEAGGRRRRFGAVGIAVVMLVLGLAGGLLIGRAVFTEDEPSGLAPAAITEMLAARVDAVNTGTHADIASFYADDAVLEELDRDPALVTETASEVGWHLSGYQTIGLDLAQAGTPISLGRFVAEPLRWSGGFGGMVVYLLDDDGRIAHQWVTGAAVPSTEVE